MKVKELKERLSHYPEDMEVVLLRPECEDYEENPQQRKRAIQYTLNFDF